MTTVPTWTVVALPLISACIGFLGSYFAARLLRRTGTETVAVMREGTRVTRAAAEASERSADAAQRSSRTAENAERELSKFRMHDDTMRTLYWAADHAISPESNRALLGLEILATLVQQAKEDMNVRAGQLLTATAAAVRKVAIPTFLAVLTTAVSNANMRIGASGDGQEGGSAGSSGGGGRQLRVSAVEINAARLLLAHATDLTAELRGEIERIAGAIPGTEITVDHLYTGRRFEQPRGVIPDLTRIVPSERELELDRAIREQEMRLIREQAPYREPPGLDLDFGRER